MKLTNEQIAYRFGCTLEEVCQQHSKNASELSEMADRAQRTGKRVNHYTEAELRSMAAESAARAK